VERKGIMPMNVEFKALPVTIVRSRVTMPEIAMHQGLNQRQLEHKEVDLSPRDVSTAWARK
ncbi:hypothetical protein A2U01_0118673, partial [Trifolium medium]|nr:hypothetical protein [Trifolium medium]